MNTRGTSTALARATAMACVVMAAASAVGCSKRNTAQEGVIVRQVLHGKDSLGDTAPEARAVSGPKVLQPGQVTTTLVADTPQAFYKQAAEGTRRKLETDGPRQALNQLESQIEQEQENAP